MKIAGIVAGQIESRKEISARNGHELLSGVSEPLDCARGVKIKRSFLE